MTKKELAKKLDGAEYPFKLADVFHSEAKESGLFVMYGISDDGVGFDGAIHDSIGCYEGGTIYLDNGSIVKNICDSDDCPYHQTKLRLAKTVEALWCVEDGYAWTYKTEIPHETFEIVEDGEPYCRGIVLSTHDF
jgi:hypothetical protein